MFDFIAGLFGKKKVLDYRQRLRLPKPMPKETDMLGPEGHDYRDRLYRALDGKQIKYLCGEDNNCCPSCWPLDGTIWDIDDNHKPVLPRHDKCRCLYIPYTTNERKQIARRFLIRGIQIGPRGGKKKVVLSNIKMFGTMDDWIRTLPSRDQRGFFASDLAYSLWHDRKIKGIDMIDTATWELRTDEKLCRIFM